jgi:hypothetical protein
VTGGEIPSAAGSGDEVNRAIHDVINTLGGTGAAPNVSFAPGHADAEQTPDGLLDFEPYRTEVQAIEGLMKAGEDPRSIPGYIDQGSHVGVFSVGEGRYLAKIPHPEDNDEAQVIERIKQAFLRGKGEDGLAQIVSYSDEEPHAVLVEPVPGDTLADIEARDRITRRAYRDKIRCYREMQRLGLATDNHASENTILTPDGKLVTVDYEYNPDQTLEEKVLSFGSNYALLQDEEPGDHDGVLPQYAWRYFDVCYDEFGPELANKLKEQWRSYGYWLP